MEGEPSLMTVSVHPGSLGSQEWESGSSGRLLGGGEAGIVQAALHLVEGLPMAIGKDSKWSFLGMVRRETCLHFLWSFGSISTVVFSNIF